MWKRAVAFGIVVLFLAITVTTGKKSEGLICNVCNSVKEGQITACRELSSYFSTNCTARIPYLKYCVLINGNLTTVESTGLKNQAIGPRRSCEFDLDRYELFTKDLKPGCFKRTVDKEHYLAFAYFHFDGEICLCNDEDNCNSGETWVPKQKPATGNNSVSTIALPNLILFAISSYSILFFVFERFLSLHT